jgi:hypothetical protein
VVLFVFRIPPEQKSDSLLSGKFPSLQKSEYHRSNSLWNTLLQRAVELRRRSLILLHCPPEQPLLPSCGLLKPRWSKLLCEKSSSYRKSRAKVHPDGRHFKEIRSKNEILNFMKMSSRIVRTSDQSNYTICSLPQSRDTIPLGELLSCRKM